MAKLYTMFASSTSLDAILKQLEVDDNVSDVKVFGSAEEDNTYIADPLATSAPVGISQSGAGILFAGSELEGEGLSSEIAAFFSRNMENGARVVVLDTSDVDSTKALLQEAGGTVSEGG